MMPLARWLLSHSLEAGAAAEALLEAGSAQTNLAASTNRASQEPELERERKRKRKGMKVIYLGQVPNVRAI